MADDLILDEASRTKLDGIVQQMEANQEADADIQFVVSDFKQKYGVKKKRQYYNCSKKWLTKYFTFSFHFSIRFK